MAFAREAVARFWVVTGEDAEDIAAFDASMGEDGRNLTWEEVGAELGWN